jgi:hypothetical protein
VKEAARAFVSVYVAMMHWMGLLEFEFVFHAMQLLLPACTFAFSFFGGDCGQV